MGGREEGFLNAECRIHLNISNFSNNLHLARSTPSGGKKKVIEFFLLLLCVCVTQIKDHNGTKHHQQILKNELIITQDALLYCEWEGFSSHRSGSKGGLGNQNQKPMPPMHGVTPNIEKRKLR